MPRINLDTARKVVGKTNYPGGYAEKNDLYEALVLGDAVGLTQFGVALETLYPGGMSSQRHWHENEDEFLYVVSGALVLVEDDGETDLQPGDAVGWAAGAPNGHHVLNRSDQNATYLIFGIRADTDQAHYPDIDLHYVRDDAGPRFLHKDGTPYEGEQND